MCLNINHYVKNTWLKQSQSSKIKQFAFMKPQTPSKRAFVLQHMFK